MVRQSRRNDGGGGSLPRQHLDAHHLKRDAKATVDRIVDELEKLPAVDRTYELWWPLQCELEDYYSQASDQLPAAQYALGKLYLTEQDQEQAQYWFTRSAEQRNEYAQFFLARWDNLNPPSVMLSVTRLLCHMSRIFQDAPAPHSGGGLHIDRKWLAQLREKKIAMGHKPDDHEDPVQEQGWDMSMM